MDHFPNRNLKSCCSSHERQFFLRGCVSKMNKTRFIQKPGYFLKNRVISKKTGVVFKKPGCCLKNRGIGLKTGLLA